MAYAMTTDRRAGTDTMATRTKRAAYAQPPRFVARDHVRAYSRRTSNWCLRVASGPGVPIVSFRGTYPNDLRKGSRWRIESSLDR